MAYDINAENSTLCPRTLYALYVGPNDNGIGYLIFRLSKKQILTTMKRKPVPVPENLFKSTNEKDPFTTKIQINRFDSDRFIGQDDHFDDTKDDGQTQSNKVDHFEDESHNEVVSPHQLDCMESKIMFHQENQILLIVRSSKSTSKSMTNSIGITNTSTFLQGLFLQYLHKAVITIVCLQPSLLVSLYENILRNLYQSISTVVRLLSSLFISPRSEFVQSSLLVSLRSEIIRSSLLASLQSKFIQSYILVFL